MPPGLNLDQPWKQYVYAFTRDHLHHSAWGLSHSERDYFMSKELAAREHLQVDDDVLFAAAFLHDMGGFAPYQKPGVDHAIRSAEIAGDVVLRPAGFPQEKITAVAQAIRTHSYYDPTPPQTVEATLLHDADTLDFLGSIAVARITSLTERDPVAQDLPTAVHTLETLMRDAPKSLYLTSSKAIGEVRVAEMRTEIDALKSETADLQTL